MKLPSLADKFCGIAVCSPSERPFFAHLVGFRSVWLSVCCLFSMLQGTFAATPDFMVTSPGSLYSINGMQPNPTLTLVRGETYTFAISTASAHPFRINSPVGTTTNNNISSGTITFKVPTNAVNYTYQCSIHGFGGTIVTIPPPIIRILNLAVGSNIVLKSTGTNNWMVIPEFTTNLTSSNWFAMTVETNQFASGTNETICGRPLGSNVFIRIKSQRN